MPAGRWCVLQRARLVNRILSYPNTTCNTSACAVWHHGRLDKIASTQVLSALRTASKAAGSARLGFEPSEMGTHSLRSGAAMKMYLAGAPVYTIMLIGRDRQMVERRISTLHKKASGTVLAAHREINAHVPVVLNDTGNRTKSSFDRGPLLKQYQNDSIRIAD